MSTPADLRAAFAQKGESAPHPSDARRIEDDKWLQKFLDHHDGDLNLALKMLVDTCAWRKTFGTNDLDLNNVNQDYLKEGLFYPRGRDCDGYTILIFKSKKHLKGQKNFDELMRCLVYWFERLDKIEHCDRISIFFDMENTGLSNMDLEFTKYIINLFKLYYPDFLNYILIFEMSWVLNASFKIIKALLPAKAVEKMKFLTKKENNLSQFVPMDQAQKCWGGQDEYNFTFHPVNILSANDASSKKVTFADPGSPTQENPPGEEDEQKLCMMSLSPRSVITFANNTGGFSITNTHDSYIAYKIKTTVPEKLKVCPNVGVLEAGKSEYIKIILTSQNQVIDPKIKFLVVCTPVQSELSSQELGDIWKNMSKLKLEQKRLQCSFPSLDLNKKKSIIDTTSHISDSEKEIVSLNQSILSLKTSHELLTMQLKSLKTIQLVNVTLSALLLCLIFYFFRNSQSSEAYGEFCPSP